MSPAAFSAISVCVTATVQTKRTLAQLKHHGECLLFTRGSGYDASVFIVGAAGKSAKC